MEAPTFRLVLGSVLILVASACGDSTSGETTSTPGIEPAVTESTVIAATVTTTSAPTETTTTAVRYDDYGTDEDEAPNTTLSVSTTSSTSATATTQTTTTTLPASTSTTLPATTTTMHETRTVDVGIVNFSFEAASITIKVGDTVRWTVNSGTHTTTSASGVWNSNSKATGEVFSFTFDEAGSYSYFCSIHPSMQATITVEE